MKSRPTPIEAHSAKGMGVADGAGAEAGMLGIVIRKALATFLAVAIGVSSASAQSVRGIPDRRSIFGGRCSFGATIDASFGTGRYCSLLSQGRLTYTGGAGTASQPSGTCADAAGNYHTFAANVPRICSGTGIEVEEARTNGIRNNTMQGAVAGSPGTLPTNWGTQSLNSGLTQTVSLQTVNGLSCISLNYTGTTIGTTGIQISFDNVVGHANPITYGQTWSASMGFQVTHDDANVSAFNLEQWAYQSGGTFNEIVGGQSIYANRLTFNRVNASATFSLPTDAYTESMFRISSLPASTAINWTAQFCAPQQENNSLINSTVASAVTTASGTGGVNGTAVYSVGGGTCSATPTLNVTWTSGTLTVNSVANAGSCTVFPQSAAALTYVSGTASGWTGATVTLTPTNNAILAGATTPILTYGSAVTRAADAGYFPNMTGLGGGMSILAIGTPEMPTGYPVGQIIAQLDDGTGTNVLQEQRNSTSGQTADVVGISSVFTGANNLGAWAQNTSGELSSLAKTNSIKGSFNNGTIGSGSPTGLPAVNRLYVGLNRNANWWNGSISRIIVSPNSLLAH